VSLYVALRRNNWRWKAEFDDLIDTGWNEVRRTATHLLGPPGPDVADAFLDSKRAQLQPGPLHDQDGH